MLHLGDQLAEFAIATKSYVSPPWSFRKIAIDASAVFGMIVLYVIFRTDWVAEFRAVPGRVRFAWQIYRQDLLIGMAFVPAGIMLGWYTWHHGLGLHELGSFTTLTLGVCAASLVGVGGLYILRASVALLFSPFVDEAPDTSGLELVRNQQAYGDARAADAREVDAALRGGTGGLQHEFED